VASINVYAGWIATFFSWVLLPIIQPINLYRLIRSRRLRKPQTLMRPVGRAMTSEAPSLGD